MKFVLYIFILTCILFACNGPPEEGKSFGTSIKQSQPATEPYEIFFKKNPLFQLDGFDFPVGKPDAKGYYDAQPFGKNNHLGEDWNGVNGGNSDLGDPIFVAANGYVREAKHCGPGWGNVIRIIHFHERAIPSYIESIYAHCDSILVKKGQGVVRGEQIATIGNADGAYYAHLHFELRDSIHMPIGGGYSANTDGYLDPGEFIRKNRVISK